MNFKKINEIEFETLMSRDKQNFKKMTSDEREAYIQEYLVYRKLFTEYIIDKLNLKEYDKKIKTSGLNFKPNEIVDMDLYQYFSSDILDYLYIRNNIYIDRLEENERKFLRDRIETQNYELDDFAKEYIENTYRNIVIELSASIFGETEVFYGPNTMRFAAPSNALVIGMRYDEFAEDGLSDEAWIKQRDEQFLFIYSLFDMMEYSLSNEINMPVRLIKYNEYSVISKSSIEVRKEEYEDTEER